MMYITGDVHGAISIGSRLNTKNFPEQKQLTKEDYVIVSGDFGLIWNMDKEDQFWLKWLDQTKPFTTLFIDGNHENFDLLNEYPVEMWNGGKVHKINDSVIHLMRGQVYTIEGKKFFTFGGAPSHDKEYRKEGISWWKQELPSDAEYQEGLKNLEQHDWKVDYVITHTCSTGSLEYINVRCNLSHQMEGINAYFHRMEEKLTYEQWFFGHYHEDFECFNNQRLLYNDMIQLA